MTANAAPDATVRALTAEQAIARTGATYRCLDYWTRRGWLFPDNAGGGSGTQRLWPVGEVEIARLMVALIDAGLTPYGAARAARNGGRLPGGWTVHPPRSAPRDRAIR